MSRAVTVHTALPPDVPATTGARSRANNGDNGVSVLEISDLHVEIPSEAGVQRVVNGISLTARSRRTLAVVGESGSGKTMSFLTVMDLLPARAVVTGGEIRVHGRNLLAMNGSERRRLRGTTLAMVFQDALTGLSPSFTIGKQISDVLRYHSEMSRRQARQRAAEILDLVRIPDAPRRMNQYPHQLSGGMRQRVMIGMAVAMRPDLLIADEPTTALDVTVQEQILDLLHELRDDLGMALVLITHDLGLVARYADDVGVMYGGRFVETGSATELFDDARHPYTVALRGAIPRPDHDTDKLSFISGHPPPPSALPSGCAFAPRCFLAHGRTRCDLERPELIEVQREGHATACHFSAELIASTTSTTSVPHPREMPSTTRDNEILRVESVSKTYRTGGRFGSPALVVRAVDDVTLTLYEGETLGLVGESGCGKTTLSRIILGLTAPTTGRIVAAGSTSDLPGRDRTTQIVFQDPYASLDPRQRIAQIVAEPLSAAGVPRDQRRTRVAELLGRIGLPADHGNRYPHQFSGGQRQRIGIARSIALTPRILVLDEPVSALDVSIQAQVLNMLTELRDELGLSYLLISHDLSVIRQVSDRVAVMYLGRIVELADKVDLYERPQHPYTEALLSAAPIPDVDAERSRSRVRLHGDLVTAPDTHDGCPLRSRCHRARDIARAAAPDAPSAHVELDAIPELCRTVRPELRGIGGGHVVACHFPPTTTTTPTETPVADPQRRG